MKQKGIDELSGCRGALIALTLSTIFWAGLILWLITK